MYRRRAKISYRAEIDRIYRLRSVKRVVPVLRFLPGPSPIRIAGKSHGTRKVDPVPPGCDSWRATLRREMRRLRNTSIKTRTLGFMTLAIVRPAAARRRAACKEMVGEKRESRSASLAATTATTQPRRIHRMVDLSSCLCDGARIVSGKADTFGSR